MKQYFGAILRFFKAVFFTFGLLIFLFCVRRYLPGFNGSQGVGLVELRLCLAMAVVFSMAHTIITSDRVPIRISLIATGILSSITCGVLSVYSGIPSAIIRWFDITDTTVAIILLWSVIIAIWSITIMRLSPSTKKVVVKQNETESQRY